MVDGYWLRLDSSDLTGEIVTAESTYCYLKAAPINAPFNIIGSQAYADYYVEHNFAEGTMTFTPHPDSLKPQVYQAEAPDKELSIKMASENTPNGDLWALVLAIATACTAYAALVYTLYTDGSYTTW